MSRLLFAVILCASAAYASVQITSAGFSQNGDLLRSNSSVLVQKPGYFARAHSAAFDDKNKILYLDGDVYINNQNQNLLAKSAKLWLGANEAEFSDFFITNSFLELWLRAKNSQYKNDKFLVNGSVVSSCATKNPEWRIDFSSGEFNNKSKDLRLKNMVFRYHNVPLFYMPYFRINTDDSRKSGLLTPKLAYKSKEGLYYEQPIFWAISHAADLELRAQIRSARGMGSSARFRLADSPYSFLQLDLGYFREFSRYAKNEQLKYQEHFGSALHYERSKIFKQNPNHQEGLYIDYQRVNDIDYLNLSSFARHNDDYLITSKFNYFYTDNKDLFGLYAKLYQDTTKSSQATTIQELPSLQYHRFYEKIGAIDYRFDAAFSNYHSRSGRSLSLLKASLPLSFKRSFFDDLLNFELQEKAEASFLSKKLKDGDDFYYQLISSAAVGTNIFKRYDDFLHNINLSLKLGYNSARNISPNEFFTTNEIFNGYFVQLRADQNFIFNDESILKHSLIAHTKSFKPQIIESDIHYEGGKFNIWSNIKFNSRDNSLERFFIQASTHQKNYEFGTGFYYNKRFDDPFMLRANYERNVVTHFKFDIDSANQIYAKSYFNTTTKRADSYAIGFMHKRRCINYTLEWRQRRSSHLTQSGVKSRKDQGLYLRFNLYPIGGVKYNFALGENNDI